MESTVHDVALIFEGGGMRNSYSAGALAVMLETGLFFDDVYGLSAGATNTIDYLSRDVRRAEASFTASLDDLAFRWWIAPFASADGVRAALHGHALARPGYALPFDFAAFQANPARATLQAIDRDSGATAYFTRRDFPDERALMERVRASTSYPVILPPTWIGGRALYDGGIGDGAGIMLPRAEADGLRRFFVVCTRPRGFRRRTRPQRLYDVFFWRRPAMRAALTPGRVGTTPSLTASHVWRRRAAPTCSTRTTRAWPTPSATGRGSRRTSGAAARRRRRSCPSGSASSGGSAHTPRSRSACRCADRGRPSSEAGCSRWPAC